MDDRSGTITQYQIQFSCQLNSLCQQIQMENISTPLLIYEIILSHLRSGERYTFCIAACVQIGQQHICGAQSRHIVTIPTEGMCNHINLKCGRRQL